MNEILKGTNLKFCTLVRYPWKESFNGQMGGPVDQFYLIIKIILFIYYYIYYFYCELIYMNLVLILVLFVGILLIFTSFENVLYS